MRRLFGLESSPPNETFFLDLDEILLLEGDRTASWAHIERRRIAVSFVEDLGEWRREFGNPALFSLASKEEWKRAKSALEWLGFKVKGEGRGFTTSRRDDAQSVRRQNFPDALGTPLTVFVSRLRAGEKVSVESSDEKAPLPFGLAAWRETLDEPGLSLGEAFCTLSKTCRRRRLSHCRHSTAISA